MTNALTAVYDNWTRPNYEVRVRAPSPTNPKSSFFLWGSAGITTNINFDKPLILHLRNEIFGDEVSLGTQDASGAETQLGTLQPGECISLQLQNLTGLFATCGTESIVACLITS